MQQNKLYARKPEIAQLLLLLFAICSLLFLSTSCKKNRPGRNKPPVKGEPIQLAHGKPIGMLVTETIGTQGGVVTSADGTMKMEVPAGAVDVVTNFSIQEVENVLKNSGKSYRLLPEGIEFKKPVTLTYHYGNISLEGRNPDFLFLAYQDKEGYFYSANKTRGNRQAQTLSVTTTHFSDWTFYAQYDLHFPGRSLTNGELKLMEGEEAVIELKTTILDKLDDEYGRMQLPQLHTNILAQKATWDYAPKKGTMLTNALQANSTYKAPAKVETVERVYINITINGDLGTDNLGNKVQQMQIRQPVVISPEGYFILTENGAEIAATEFSGEYEQLIGSQIVARFPNGYTLSCYIYGGTGGFPYNQHYMIGSAVLELSQNDKDGMVIFRPKICGQDPTLAFSPGTFNMNTIAQRKGEYFEGEFTTTMYGYDYCQSGRTKSLSGKFRFKKIN